MSLTTGSLLCRHPWTEIFPGLWQGCHDYIGEFDEHALAIVDGDEWDLVVSLYTRPGHGPIGDVDHIRLSIPDGHLLVDDLAQVQQVAETVAAAIGDGLKVLVRCQAGLNRSGLVVAYALTWLGYTPEQAITRIRERRSPNALFNQHFVRYLTGGDQ